MLRTLALFLLFPVALYAQVDLALDEVVHIEDVLTFDSDGNKQAADDTPTCSVFEEDTDTAILSAQNMTARTGPTAQYRYSFTASAANGFELGKWYNVICEATVDALDQDIQKGWFRVVQAENTAGIPTADTTHFSGTAGTANDNGADINAILVDTSTTLDDFIDTEIAAILADTGTDGVVINATTQASIDAIETDTSTTLDDLVDDLESRLGIPSDLAGGGATVAGNLADIESQTDDIGASGAGLTALPLRTLQNGVAVTNFLVYMVDASGDPVTGLTDIVCATSEDGGAFNNIADTTETEIGNGVYALSLTGAEVTANVVAVRCTSATAGGEAYLVFLDMQH